MMDWPLILLFLGAYVLGSIPFGLLVSKILGSQDPRGAGSGNIGFTNVLRLSGKTAGVLTLLGDFGKGLLVALFAQVVVGEESLVLGISFAVILGHIFSIFLWFKGGKGVATALGVVLGLDVMLGLILIGIWGISVLVFKYSSGGALVAFGLFPLIVGLNSASTAFLIFSVLVSVCIFWRHQSNIIRIVQGTESKVNNTCS